MSRAYRRFIPAVCAALLSAALSAAAIAESPDDLFAVASAHYVRQRWRGAADEFQRLLDSHPGFARSADARFFHAESLLQLGDYDAARAAYSRLIEIDGPNGQYVAAARFRRGESALLQSDDARATQWLIEFRSHAPDDPLNDYALMYLGELSLRRGEAEKARSLFSEGLERFPHSPLGARRRFGLAESLERQQDFDAARRFYTLLADDAPPTPAMRSTSSAKNSAWEFADDASLRLAVMDHRAGRHDAAGERLVRFDARFPTSPFCPDAMHWLGETRFAQQRWREAADVWIDVSTRFPDHAIVPASLFRASDALLKMSSVDAMDLAHSVDPSSESAPSKEPATPLENAERTLEQGDEVTEPTDGDDARAEADSLCKRIVEGWPSGEWADDAFERRVRLAVVGKRFQDAANLAAEFESRFDRSPFLAEVRRLHSRALLQLGPDAGRSDGLDPQVLWTLGQAQVQQRDSAAAVSAFSQLVDRFPNHDSALDAARWIAAIYERDGDDESAADAHLNIARRWPATPQAAEALFAAVQAFERAGRFRAAVVVGERLVNEYAEFGKLDVAVYQLAWDLDECGEAASADRLFQRLAELHPDSEYWGDAAYRLAEQAARRSERPEARRWLDRLLGSPNVPAPLRNRALYLAAQIAAHEQNWDEVRIATQRLLEGQPDSELRLPAEYWHAEASFRTAHYDEATAQFNRLFEATRENTENWVAVIALRRAQLLGRSGDWSGAYAAAKEVAQRFEDIPNRHELDYLLGRCHMSRGELVDARAAFDRVIHAPEAGRSETAAMAEWMVGETYLLQRRYDDALRAYHRVETLYGFPRWQAAALLQAAKCHEASRRPAEAAAMYRQVATQFPSTPFAQQAAERLRSASQE